MKALFIHDHLFYSINEHYYSRGGLPASTWDRYLKHFNGLTVISRGEKVDIIKNGLVLSSAENVSFHLLYSVKGGLDYYKHKADIETKLLSHINQSDAIFIRLPSTLGFFAVDLCRKINKPYIVEIVGCAWDSIWNYGTILHKIYAPFAYFQMRIAVKNSMAAHYVTRYFLQKRYPMSGIQTYASNVLVPFAPNIVLKNHIDFLNRNNNYYKIGIIGNISVKYKGYDTALKALALLKKTGIKFQFYLVGGGDAAYVKHLIQANQLQDETVIVGSVKAGEAIFQFLDGLDLYIHPSRQEGLPRAVIEAMSRGCPVIASNIAGIPELLPEEYRHNPDDYKSLYRKMNIILRDKNQLIETAKQNFIQAQEYQIDKIRERLDNFYNQVQLHLCN
jgi:glycosyltransferase involved in cell wall biosynthesis